MRKDLLAWAVGSAVYFSWFGGVVGLRSEHVWVWALLISLWFFVEKSQQTIKDAAPWFLVWLLYDSLRVAPNWTVNAVHIKDLYDFDKKWFGVAGADGQILTLNEWSTLRARPFLDLMAGAFYISWVPLPGLFGAWLYWKKRPIYHRFAWCFFFVNVLGVSIYYLFPAAPPWYVSMHGFDFLPFTEKSSAGLDRVDKLLEIDLFKKMYSRNSNVFAAMPSLHSAYPLVAWIYAAKSGRRWAFWLFAITSVGIWVSAIYTNHHYVLDVLAGISVAAIGFWLFERFFWRENGSTDGRKPSV